MFFDILPLKESVLAAETNEKERIFFSYSKNTLIIGLPRCPSLIFFLFVCKLSLFVFVFYFLAQ